MKIIVTGDKSKYQFFRNMVKHQFLSTEKLGKQDYYLTSNRNEQSDNIFFCERVPLNTCVCFPQEYGETSISYERNDKVLFFDEFPYGTDEKMLKLEEIMMSKVPLQVEVVLYINERKGLESDISTHELAAEKIEKKYKKNNILVHRYKNYDIPNFLLFSSDNQYDKKIKRFKQLIENVDLYNFDLFYEIDYEVSLKEKIEDPKILDQYFDYSKQLMTKNVWEVYKDKAYDYFWNNTDDFDSFITELYWKNIEEICLWDFSEDIKKLKKEVRKKFLNCFKNYKYTIYNNNEKKYQEFLQKNMEEVIRFKKDIITFFSNDLKNYVRKRIEKKVERMEWLLNEYGN